ncbi:MAG: hypothetical protein AAB719_02320 [Patescibacteria group bacterium]
MDTMLSKALREFTTGPLNQLIVNLSGHDGELWEREFKRFLRKEFCWHNGRRTQEIVIPAATSWFFVREKFVCDSSYQAKVRIHDISEFFTLWFLSGDGKIEGPISEQTLLCYKLSQPLTDGPIIDGLGGVAKVETTLSEMFYLMEKQGRGESGILLNNGYSNIFYVKDQGGTLRSIGVRWESHDERTDSGWEVHAYHATATSALWDPGHQVFYRSNS